jgi:hypothetical protein
MEECLFSKDLDWAAPAARPKPPQDDGGEDDGAKKQRIRPVMLELTPEYLYRRAWSESCLLDLLEEFRFVEGHCYNFLTGGDIDELSYLRAVLRSQTLDHCLISTWSMFSGDGTQILEWVKEGKIAKADIYVGEIFKASYSGEWKVLHDFFRADPDKGRICVFRNHAKIIAGRGPKFAFGLQSSANVGRNPRTENACLQIGEAIYNFYNDYFSKIITFEKEDRDAQARMGLQADGRKGRGEICEGEVG